MSDLEALSKTLAAEDALGVVIRIHLYCERELHAFIDARTPIQVLDALRPTYERKIDLAVALRLPAGYARPLRWLGEKRNKFAHDLDAALTPEDTKTFRERMDHAFPAQLIDPIRTISEFDFCAASFWGQQFAELSPKDQFSICAMVLWIKLRVENCADKVVPAMTKDAS